MVFGCLVEVFEKRASEPARKKDASASQQGKLGRETLQDRSATKNGECWGLYLAAKG